MPQANSGAAARAAYQSEHLTCGNDDAVSLDRVAGQDRTAGDRVAYDGHLLYTFADDQPGQVTGQGVQGFFVATPGLTAISGSPAQAAPASPSGNPYGYRPGNAPGPLPSLLRAGAGVGIRPR